MRDLSTAMGSPSGLGRRILDYALARPTGSVTRRAAITIALIIGSALVATTSAVHLHLWDTGYRDIPTIGPLFLVQGIAGVVIAIVLLASRRLFAVVAAAGFMLATIAGLLLSVNVGLFGFMDSLSAPFADLSLIVESAGTLVLAAVGIAIVVPSAPAE